MSRLSGGQGLLSKTNLEKPRAKEGYLGRHRDCCCVHQFSGARTVVLPPGMSTGALGERVVAMCTLSSYLSYMLFATQQVGGLVLAFSWY